MPTDDVGRLVTDVYVVVQGTEPGPQQVPGGVGVPQIHENLRRIVDVNAIDAVTVRDTV